VVRVEKSIVFSLIMLSVPVALFELASWTLYRYHPKFDHPEFKLDYFNCDICQLDRFHPQLGWNTSDESPTGDGIREDDESYEHVCGATFGDSFTYGNEVEKNETIAAELSSLLKCQVQNFGVGGYGLDQAILKLKHYKSSRGVIFLAVYDEMLKRSAAASWRFYAGRKSLPKPLYALEKGKLTLYPPPDPLDAVRMREHHIHDHFRANHIIRFPYSYHVTRYLINNSAPQLTQRANNPWDESPFRELAFALLEEARQVSSGLNRDIVYVFITSPKHVTNHINTYAAFHDEFKRRNPGVCVVDTFPALYQAFSQQSKSLSAPNGHYLPVGNKIIATSIFTAINTSCDLRGMRMFRAEEPPLRASQPLIASDPTP